MHTEGSLSLIFQSASSRKKKFVSLLAEIHSRNLRFCLPLWSEETPSESKLSKHSMAESNLIPSTQSRIMQSFGHREAENEKKEVRGRE